jgi:hypothetical protein
MEQEVSLVKEIYGKTTYTSVVDTTFRQLVTPTEEIEEDMSIEEFFIKYEQLFFDIPINGEINSHEYLVKRSSDYVGASVLSENEKALIDEINSLRQQLLEANKSLVDVSKLA